MDFAKTRVLIDSHDLALPFETGIKSYGLTLLAALQRLGMAPEILASAHWHGDPLVARARVHDVPLAHIPAINPRDEKRRHWLRRPRTAEHVSLRDTEPFPMPTDLFPFGRDCSVLPFIYEHATAVQEQLFFPTHFRTRQKYDIWHATLPLPLVPEGLRTITTIHDLIPLLQPHTCDTNRAACAENIRLAIRQSCAIATVSEYTKRDLLTHFDVPEEKIVVTHQPTHWENWAPKDYRRERVLRALNLDRQGYLLCVGNIEPKKNVGNLIKAYLSLKCDLPLVIVGHKAWRAAEQLALLDALPERLRERVRVLGHIDRGWLPYIYESAYALLFASLYEGFGLPVLEAMTLGCPVLCSRICSLPEVGGNAVDYIDPHDLDSITDGIERLLNDRPHRDALATRGRVRARLFSMKTYTAKLARLYAKALA